jgi:hypothetical protein
MPGVTRWNGRELSPELTHCLRVWPHHQDTGGFFMAVLEKDACATEPIRSRRSWTTRMPPSGSPVLDDKYGLGADYWTLPRQPPDPPRMHLMAADHAPPAVPVAESSGLFFHRTNTRPPKPSTGGSLLFGRDVTRFGVALNREQRDRYLRRETLRPDARAAGRHADGPDHRELSGTCAGCGRAASLGGDRESVSEPVEWVRCVRYEIRGVRIDVGLSEGVCDVGSA